VIDYRSVNFKNLRKALLMRLSEIFYAYNCKRRETKGEDKTAGNGPYRARRRFITENNTEGLFAG
jgi:hypothetical protein